MKYGRQILTGKLAEGNEKAFRQLFEELYPSLCLFAGKYVDPDTAADIVQDAFVSYFKKAADFDDLRGIRAYLYILVQHRSINAIRDRKVSVEYTDVGEGALSEDRLTEDIMEQETMRLFHNAVEELPRQMRTIILYTLDGYRNAEIAEFMGLSEQSVKSYKKEAYKKLRTILRDVILMQVFAVLLK